jgi:hypothetical protein
MTRLMPPLIVVALSGCASRKDRAQHTETR